MLAALGLAGVTAVLVCAGVVLYVARDELRTAWEGAQPAAMPAVEVESAAERQADLQAGFAAAGPDVDEQRLAEIRTLFDALIAATSTDDEAAFLKLLDAGRFVRRMKASGLFKRMSNAEERAYTERMTSGGIGLPGDWKRYRIYRVRPVGSDEAVVTAAAWEEDDYPTEMRVWVCRGEAGWRIFDWDLGEFGKPASYIMAAYDTRRSTAPSAMRYSDDVENALALQAQGQTLPASQALRRAEERPLIMEVADTQLVRIGFAWLNLQRPRDALKCVARIPQAETVSGALEVRILALQRLGRYRETLDLLDQHALVSGNGPVTVRLRAETYTHLDMYDRALDAWEHLLRDSPDNAEALQSFVRLLDDDDVGRLRPLLLATKQPVETAITLLERTFNVSAPLCAELIAVGEATAAGSPATLYLRGLAEERQENYEQAAELYRQVLAIETDEDRKDRAEERFLDAHVHTGDVLAGYAQAPDPRAAFEYLTSGFEDGEVSIAPDQLRALLAAHRERDPDDPGIPAAAAALFEDEGNYAAAAEAFEEAARLDEDMAESYRDSRVRCLAQMGRALEAYQQIPPAERTFRTLVETLSSGSRQRALAEVIEAHARAFPDDPWLAWARAKQFQREGRAAEAIEVLLPAMERAALDDMDQYQWKWLLIALCAEAGQVGSALPVLDSDDRTLNNLVQQLIAAEKLDAVQSLIDQQGRLKPGDPRLSRWEVALAWYRSDYEKVVRALTPWPLQFDDDFHSFWIVGDIRETYVRSLLHLGRVDEARRFAAAQAEEGQRNLLAIVLAHEQKVDELLAIAADRPQDESAIAWLYRDSDLGNVMRGPAFLRLREAVPPHFPVGIASNAIVLMFRGAPELSTETLLKTAREVLGPTATVDTQSATEGAAAARARGWLVRHETGRLLVTLSGEPYTDEKSLAAAASELDDDRQGRLAAHRGWLRVVELAAPPEKPGTTRPWQSARLAATLASDDCSIVYFENQGWVALNSDTLRSDLASGRPKRPASAAYTFLGERGEEEPRSRESREADRKLRQSVRTFWRRFARRDPAVPYRFACDLTAGPHRERLWLELYRVVRSPYGGQTLYARMVEASQWDPNLKEGEPVAVSPYEVVDWTIGAGERAERAPIEGGR